MLPEHMQAAITEGLVSFDEFQEFIQELATTEGRLAVSALVLFLLLVLGVFVVPYLLRKIVGFVRYRILTDEIRAIVDVMNDYIPSTIGDLVVRTGQVIILFVGVVSLLIVWGLIEIAVGLTRFVGLSLPLIGRVGITIAILVFAYIAVDILEDAVKEFSAGADRVTEHQEEIILRMGHVGVLAIAFATLLSLWGYDLSGLIVGAGFLGIVIGLAARQTLGSMIAGFVLMFSRPFTIGDWVEVGGHEGIITSITIMNTRMQNFDGESIVIPNDVVGNQPITNRSKRGILRIRLEVGIDYETDPDHAEQIILDTLEEVDILADSPPPRVVPTGFGDSAILLEARFWIEDPNPPKKWEATTAVVHAIKERFDEEEIKIPYPQRELSGREETGGFRIRGQSPPTSQHDGDDQESHRQV